MTDKETLRVADDGSIPLSQRVRNLEKRFDRYEDCEDEKHERLRERVDQLEKNRSYVLGICAAVGTLVGFALSVLGLIQWKK